MFDMPQVNPRNMHALLVDTVATHVQIRDDIANAAVAREVYYAEKDKELNAKARLEGKTAT